MKYLLIFISSLFLSGCIDVSSFQQPKQYFVWQSNNMEKYFQKNNPYWVAEYFDQREKDAQDCGIEPVVGKPDSAEAGLCMESKGWHLDTGPVCNNRKFYNAPLCVQWRAKYKG